MGSSIGISAVILLAVNLFQSLFKWVPRTKLLFAREIQIDALLAHFFYIAANRNAKKTFYHGCCGKYHVLDN